MVIREILLEGRRLHCIYCRGDKSPIGPHGWYSATTDPAALVRLGWAALIGVSTGKVNGIVAVDVDPRHGGDVTLAEKLAWLPETRRHRTMSGGEHWIYQYPEAGVPNFTGTDSNGLPGIELKSDGLGVVWPPSRGYSVIDDRPPVECPVRLIALVKTLRTRRPPAGRGGDGPHFFEATSGSGGWMIPNDLWTRLKAATPAASDHDRYRMRGLLRTVLQKRPGQGRNQALNDMALAFREWIEKGLIERGVVEGLLYACAVMNGHLAKRGKRQTDATIESGLGKLKKCGPSPLPLEEEKETAS
jgi:hypothetical protein